jgi:hypothetical protein
MSIPKLQLVPQPQPQAEVIRHAPDTLDFMRAIIVNRKQLTEALKDAWARDQGCMGERR